MLDIKFIRDNVDFVKNKLSNRGEDFSIDMIDEVVKLYEIKVKNLVEVEELKNKRNVVSNEISKLKKQKIDANELIEEMRLIGDKIKNYNQDILELTEKIEYIMLRIPNIPNDNVPDGDDDSCNVEVRRWGEPVEFKFEIKPHWDIARNLDIVDFDRSSKVTGSRFAFYKGLGATLERALINFYLDTHVRNGYTEMFPPFIANRESFKSTGQLPKFEEDIFKLENTDYFLIPTAEVPITNYFRNEIIKFDENNPVYKFASYSACFRSEAGSAGRDTRGLIRQHQFNKVELVKVCRPEDSYNELELLLNDAENLIQKLNIPYRIVKICKGDLGFSQAFKYDIEIWMPSYNRYVEISSCSNFEDFQARRANIKYKDLNNKPRFVHTLNGSGLAIGRTFAAILENFQDEEGNVTIPEVLRPYLGGIDKLILR